MNGTVMTKLGGLLAAFSLAPLAFAGAPPMCSASRSETASQMLSEIHQDAYQVRDYADRLEMYNREPFLISWQADARTLENMRDQINQMDQTLQRLRTMKAVLPQNEDAEINQITPAMVELSDTTQTAITYLRHNELLTWVPKYTAYAGEMYTEAGRIERATATPFPNMEAHVNQPAQTPTASSGA